MLTDIVPAYPHPHSAANEAVILYDGPVTFRHDRGEASGTGTLALRWVPSTGLRLRVVIGSGKALRSDGSATAFLAGGEGDFQAFSWNTNLADGQMTETVEGRIRCFRKGDGTDLASIGFQVVNFTDFLTPGPKTPPIFGFPPQAVDLDSGMWRVRLSATANHQAIFKSLTEQGGYAFTHLGRLERIDGATFSAEDADGPLHTLFRFLGFARGAAANLPIRWGVNPSGDTIWEEWRSPVVDQWKTPQNWFDENHGTLLREIFPAFVRAYEDPNLNEPLSLALHWYQACNTRAGGMEGALVLSVTNLDLLAALVVVAESRLIVLSPVRTPPRGWFHMRAVIEFDGTAPELLADLAQSGGAILFIDNLNRFAEDERLTVIDLVRAASTVPGVSVVATARAGLGDDEANWLPADALHRLVRATPITIDELSDAEIDELRHAAPQLAPLLADGHPAQQVARNLFRLSRLATRGAADSQRTEIDMARQWWDTADGPDNGRRERARVGRAVADGALAGAGTVNVDDLPPAAVDALVRSESLRDFGSDRVAFRHDVLAEWAVSCLLSDLGVFDRLPLQSPAPAILARGVELAARFAIERSPDSIAWQQLLERVSREGVHGSWRRAALLALVRSEAAAAALTRASEPLLENHARLLRELIRTVQAVDVRPASQLFAALGVDPAAVPPHINTPHGPAWFRLIMWLLALGDRLPAAAIPDVVGLYFDWSLSIWGRDPLTPLLLPWLHRWLSAIEDARLGPAIATLFLNDPRSRDHRSTALWVPATVTARANPS